MVKGQKFHVILNNFCPSQLIAHHSYDGIPQPEVKNGHPKDTC